NAARLAEDQGGAGILRVEDVLQGYDLGAVQEKLAREALVQSAEPILDRAALPELEDAVGQMADGRAAGLLDDAESAVPRTRVGPDLESSIAVAEHVLGAGFQGKLHHLVLAAPLLHRDDALAIELEGDGSGGRHAPSALGEDGPHVAGGPVLVVGEDFQHERH